MTACRRHCKADVGKKVKAFISTKGAARSKRIMALCVIMAFFLPTSLGGTQIEAEWAIANALVMGVLILLLFWDYGVSKQGIVLALIMLLYLTCSTVLVVADNDGYFSIARFAPAVAAIVLLSLRIKPFRFQVSLSIKLMDFLIGVIAVWNIACMLHITQFEGFVTDFYTQLDDYTATQYALIIGRPVFTFGVHNFASVFYLCLFYTCLKIYFYFRLRRYLIYGIVLFAFTLMLRSTAAYGTAAIMLIIFAWYLWRYRKSALKYLMVALAVAGVLVIFSNPAVVERLLLDSNGFIPRYFSNELYQGNMSFLNEHPLGLGFTIPYDGSVYLADSGFWIYLTMGNFPVLVGVFVLVCGFIISNFKGEDRWFIAINILFAELSFASLLYWKTLFLILIMAGILNGINSYSNERISDNRNVSNANLSSFAVISKRIN